MASSEKASRSPNSKTDFDQMTLTGFDDTVPKSVSVR